MNEEWHFSPENAKMLRSTFIRLSDFMHEKGIEQIVGVGPSATPYIRAIARAHRNRRGVTLKLIALGELGEQVADVAHSGKVEKAASLLSARKIQPKKTLLFDEVVHIGKQILGVKSVFDHLKIPHETATLASSSDYSPLLSFVGRKDVTADFQFYLGRGKLFKSKRNARSDGAYLARIRSELREIADSLPRK